MHPRRSAWEEEKEKKKRILIPFSSSQTETTSGMRSQIRQTQSTETGRTEQQKQSKGCPFLCLQCWPGSCRGIPGEEMLKGRSMGMGGVNQQYKRQLK